MSRYAFVDGAVNASSRAIFLVMTLFFPPIFWCLSSSIRGLIVAISPSCGSSPQALSLELGSPPCHNPRHGPGPAGKAAEALSRVARDHRAAQAWRADVV